MSDDYATGSGRRNKRKDKRRDKKKHPYKHGGAQRSMNTSNNKST